MYGKLRKDDDGHWYLVPESQINYFDSVCRDIDEFDEYSDEWDDAVDEFIKVFDKYRLSGGVGDLRIEMENENG